MQFHPFYFKIRDRRLFLLVQKNLFLVYLFKRHLRRFRVIFWIVQAQGIHLEKLKYLKDKEFEFLEKLKRRFLKRARKLFDSKDVIVKVKPKKALLKMYAVEGSRGSYEPSNISYYCGVGHFSWRRVLAWEKQMKDWHR